LHFEVRIGDNAYSRSRNPELWIAPPQGWGVLAARVMNATGGLLTRARVNIRNVDLNRYWDVITYGAEGSTNPDEYYQENMVIGDLPAGNYVIWINFDNRVYDLDLVIQPGMVTFFTFHGRRGYDVSPPPLPGTKFRTPFVPSPTPVITTTLTATP
jgi:hypothetical protein